MVGSITNGVACLYGQVVLGSGGAISSTTTDGFTIVKTAAKVGRYTITADAYNKLLAINVSVIGATDAAYTATKGLWMGLVRNNNVSTTGTVEIQLQDPATSADAEAIDNASLLIEITLKNSSV